MPSDLVVLVVVHAFDDINFAVRRPVVAFGPDTRPDLDPRDSAKAGRSDAGDSLSSQTAGELRR